MDGITAEEMSQIKDILSIAKNSVWFLSGVGAIIVAVAIWIYKTGAKIDFLTEQNVERKKEIDKHIKEHKELDRSISDIKESIIVLNTLVPRIEKLIEKLSNTGG